jgi:catechol 2,3-dioxygenase-like lactoylglutathione lyase family enzyme
VRLDGVQLSVADVDEAAHAYAVLLGVEPSPAEGGVRRFQLLRGAVEIEPGDAGLRAVRFVREPGEAGTWPRGVEEYHGLRVELTAAPAPPLPIRLAAVQAIDHVVVRTPDAERAIALWRDRLGLRLAFDRAFPARGLRLLFFRSGGITFEFATAHPPPEDRRGPDLLWGVSYRVADLAAHRERLLGAGLDVSELRPGNKAGTTVASVRSGTAGVPTLLLEEPARAS